MPNSRSFALSTSVAITIVLIAIVGVASVAGAYYISSQNKTSLATLSVTNTQQSESAMGSSLCTTFPLGSWIGGLAYDSHTNKLYVTDNSFNYQSQSAVPNVVYSLSVPPNNGSLTSIPVGSEPTDIAFDPDNNNLYVANYNSTFVSVISDATNLVIKNISVVGNPLRIAYDPFNRDIYVALRSPGNITIISTTTNAVVSSINVTPYPFDLVYDALNHDMYVTDGANSNVTIIDSSTNRPMGSFSESMGSGLMVYDSVNTELYYFPQDAQSLYVINSTTNRMVTNISGIYDLNALGFDSSDNLIYAAGNASGGFLDLVYGGNNSLISSMSNFAWIPVAFADAHGVMYATENSNDRIFELPQGKAAAACESSVSTVSLGDVTTQVTPATESLGTTTSTGSTITTSCSLPSDGTLIIKVINKTGSATSPVAGAYVQGMLNNSCAAPFGYYFTNNTTNSSGELAIPPYGIGFYMFNVTYPVSVHYFVNATVFPLETTCLTLFVPSGKFNTTVTNSPNGTC